MTRSKEPAAQGGAKDIEAPVPTIVGPRPEAGPGASISVPRGMEKLLTLAGLNAGWKEKTLADPLRAAAEADIPLTPIESAILKSIPSKTLGQMILSFVRTRLTPVRETALAAGTAAAALLATTEGLGMGRPPAPEGIRPDTHPERAESAVPLPGQISWAPSLAVALEQAAASNRAVMVVCPYGVETISRPSRPPATLGIEIVGITMEVPTSRFLLGLCRDGNESVAAAIAAAGLIAVKPADDAGHALGETEGRTAYLAMLREYGVAEVAPLVFFLAPDGTVLKQEHRADEHRMTAAIEAVPALLATWMANQIPVAPPAPRATRGHTIP